jgi:L-lactate utilization protein LutB
LLEEGCAMAVEKSDFGKAVANVYRTIKPMVENMPTIEPGVENSSAIDRSVKEQVISDIDHHIEENERS